MNNFYKIWVGDFASDIGNKMLFFIIPILGLNIMKLSPTEVGYVSTIYLSVPLILGLYLGSLADRHYSKAMLYLCNITRIIVLLIIVLLLVNNYLNWYILGAGLFILNAISLYYDSLMVSVVPQIVSQKELVKANSFIEAGNSVNSSLGPSIAGFLVTYFSVKLIFIIDIITYIWSSLLLATTDFKLKKQSDNLSENDEITYLKDIKVGFKLLFSNPSQKVILYSVSIYNFFASWLLVILPIYAIKEVGLSSYQLGMIYLFPFVFGIIGAYFTSYLQKKVSPRNIITYSLVPVAVITLLLPLNKYFNNQYLFIFLYICTLSIMEFCITINLVIDRSIRQSIYPINHLSKIESTIRFLTWGFDPFGALIASLIISFSSVFLSLSIGVIGFMLPPLICIFSKSLKKLSFGDPLHPEQ
ncbi:MAG: MFS transporter [Neisseriaceae bacterium]|nr:MAG: MFS transporter [Neisseriaceae bacterium]